MYIGNNNRLKELVEYIEKNLTEEIEYKELAKILLVNEYTLHRIFSFVTNITLAEYIRKRRLSMAAIELLENNEKVLDVAIKYQYDSGEAFARAFKKMMGFLPKEIHKNKNNIKYFPTLTFEELSDEPKEFKFEKLENVSFDFYTISKKAKLYNLAEKTPDFWKSVYKRGDIFNGNAYGLVKYNVYDYDESSDVIYYIASKEEFEGSQKYSIKNKNFLVFDLEIEKDITVKKAKDIGAFTHYIYANVIPGSGYNLDDVPDIEEYIDFEKVRIYIAVV